MKGEDVQEIRRRENAILAVNAGWFSSDNQNYLSPEYALKVGGTIFNPYRGETAGGALAIEGGGVKILTPPTYRRKFGNGKRPRLLKAGDARTGTKIRDDL